MSSLRNLGTRLWLCNQFQLVGTGDEAAAQSKLWDKSLEQNGGIIHACVVYVPSLCPDHVEDVVTAVFQYLAMIRREGPKEWIFKECAVRDRNGDLERG